MPTSEIGALFHVVHVAPSLGQLIPWYRELFGAQCFMEPSYSETEQREASLELIGDDYVIEPMTPPHTPGGDQTNIGRFLGRYGSHLHSIAWYAQDIGGLYERLTAQGVRVNGGGGVPLTAAPTGQFAAIYAHPRDAHCQLEFLSVGDEGYMRTDPRHAPGFSARYWREEQPLGIQRTSHITIVVRDLEHPTQLYEQALGTPRIHEGGSEQYGTQSVFFAVGPQSVVEFARPVAAGLAQQDLEAHGEIVHAVTFRVRDLDRALAHVRHLGIRTIEETAVAFTLDPEDAFGAVYRFTTADVPGDPRA
ncbi:MAG: hypothetical protein EXR63_00040 [Dehalococcoidia bacterium]|nr:hypothetical protein [Dehalococcoidia bacterium]